jgi:hypothetical protein
MEIGAGDTADELSFANAECAFERENIAGLEVLAKFFAKSDGFFERCCSYHKRQ